MCGRYALFGRATFERAFPAYRWPTWRDRYNVAPTDEVAVKRADGTADVVLMRWGLVPAWARDASGAAKLINARAETLAERPAFAGLLRASRAIVFASGFYEWRARGRGKEPVYFRLRSGEPLTFAALWTHWHGLASVTIVTTAPNALVAPIHDRMPAILDAAARAQWLDPQLDPLVAQALLGPADPAALEGFAVGRGVNRIGVDDPSCVVPTGPLDAGPEPVALPFAF